LSIITARGFAEEGFVLLWLVAKPLAVMIDNITNHNNTNPSSAKPQTVMIDNITNHNNTNPFSAKPQTVMIDNITNHNNTNPSSAKPIVDHYC
jgi:hypothetical protein